MILGSADQLSLLSRASSPLADGSLSAGCWPCIQWPRRSRSSRSLHAAPSSREPSAAAALLRGCGALGQQCAEDRRVGLVQLADEPGQHRRVVGLCVEQFAHPPRDQRRRVGDREVVVRLADALPGDGLLVVQPGQCRDDRAVGQGAGRVEPVADLTRGKRAVLSASTARISASSAPGRRRPDRAVPSSGSPILLTARILPTECDTDGRTGRRR